MGKILLYEVRRNLRCLKCGHLGAVRPFGRILPSQKVSRAVGPGGTIPWKCTNCNNTGLVGISLEGYTPAFEKAR